MKQVVYIASPESNQVYAWTLHKDGTLILLQILNFNGQIQPMVVSPTKDFLYMGMRPNFCVLTYRIADDGTLSLVSEAALPGSPTYISTDRQGKYLFCSSYNDCCLSVNPIDHNGLPQLPIQVIRNLLGCHSVQINPTNQKLFVPALKEDRIYMFQLNSNGMLLSEKQKYLSAIKGSGPRHIVFHPNGNYVYCIHELDSTVTVWRVNNLDKYVECIQRIDMMPKNFHICWASDIHITPNGKFLYTCDRTNNIITTFRILKDGAMLVIIGLQLTEMQPRGFNIDKTGQYLLLAGQKSNHVQVYKIKKCGLLTPIMRYFVGKGPMWIVIHELKNNLLQ
ncbi:6-phosphogluconolactonase [Candidatus Pantoea carbekii]|uniref:Uncharacterized protein n=1 Tax=Candidatus Pantoea carbekii TaxID=1235990 RepID=U3U9T2_9GAMM|nr:6-phosphogluconolactonase [Candidatus Pantoea carbekii]AKC32185.1 6-phosphogluconolactonase [Candidatus Pantoea carbekii]BAO00713.1 hypothetical protein HHS_07430 [Candidatus Pantoea carbekii]